MRTTLTIEPDVALKLKQTIAQRKTSLKQVVNEALRIGLAKSKPAPRKKFRVEPFHGGGFQPGIDPTKLNQLLDELEVEEFLKKYKRLEHAHSGR